MLSKGRARSALSLAERVLKRCEGATPPDGVLPGDLERDYASALLLQARALAQSHAPTAPLAYLRARQWTDLEPADIEFVAGYYLNHVPKTFFAFPIYVDWFQQSSDPEEAELRIRNVAEIKPNERPDEPTLPIRQELNEYLFAHFPNWLWTLDHLANGHIVYEEWDAAHACLVEWLARDSENADVLCRERLLAAYRHLRQNQLPEALSALETAMLSGGDRATLAARQLLTLVKKVTLARAQVRKIRRSFEAFVRVTRDANLLVDYAKWVMPNDEDAALTALHRAVELEPHHPLALWELAHALYKTGHLTYALDLLDRFLRVRPDDPKALGWASRIAEELGRFERVVELLERLPQRNVQQNLRLARALLELGKTNDAEETLNALASETLSEEERRVQRRLLADALFAKGDFDAAVQRYQELLEEYRDDWRLHEHLARAYMATARWAEARAAYDAVLRLNGSHVPALNGRGLAAYHLGDTGAAAEDFHESLLIQLHQPMTVYALGLCLLESDPEMARTLFEHAVESDPDLYGAWLGIARLAETAGRWGEAVSAYESALKVEYDPAVRLRLARVALRAEQFDIARPILSELVASDEQNAFLRYLLGYCCFRQGELDEAARHWSAALLEHRDASLEDDLAWLHIRLADRAAESRNRAEMTRHWNTALDRAHEIDMGSVLAPRWAREAWLRLQYPESRHPASRDFQIAHDLMTDVLAHDSSCPVYRLLAGLCAARMGDWQLCGELIEPLLADEQWGAMGAYLSALCLWDRHLPEEALKMLDPRARNWGEWEVEVQAFRAQIYLSQEDVERTAREIAMLRAQSKERCPNDLAIAVLLGLKLWRHVYDLVTELPSEERSALAHYAAGVAALMLRRETEGIQRLEQVPPDSAWGAAARALRVTGIKRRALRAFHSLGWREVAGALEEVLQVDEDDPIVREWLDRAQVFAMLTEHDDTNEETLKAHWRERLRAHPEDALPLHQWAVYAYWTAQANASQETWREAMSLWGSLLNLDHYWVRWTLARLARHDPDAWLHAENAEERSRELVAKLRSRMMVQLIADMTDAVLRQDPQSEVDDYVLDFLREYRTSELWREWLEANPTLRETVPPFGGDLLEQLGCREDVQSILATREKMNPTSCGERLLIYLSPFGSLLAAAETENPALAQARARELFNSPDPAARRIARIVYVLATRHSESAAALSPREGLERAMTAMLAAKEITSSLLVDEIDWAPLLTRLSDGLVAEVEALSTRPPEHRIAEAESARELLKRVYEATRIPALIHAIVRVTLLQARAYLALAKRGRRAADDPYFAPEDADALRLLQEALELAPEHVTLQQEAAQLRLRRGLVAAKEGRLNEALIDLARAHELDPVSHRITTAYASFMMEQAARLWGETRADAQREALALAHRALLADPTDSQLLARCARFLDLPESHPLRETPEYQRLLTLFMRQTTNDEP